MLTMSLVGRHEFSSSVMQVGNIAMSSDTQNSNVKERTRRRTRAVRGGDQAREAISASLGGDGRKKIAKESSFSLHMSVPVAVELLRERHGELAARKMADLEKRKARQARSRKRFEFWAEVATRMEHGAGARVRACAP